MQPQILVERRLVGEPVLDDAAYAAGWCGTVTEYLGRAETRQLQHVRDVIAEPGVERSLDRGVRLEVHFIDDACVLGEPDHGGKSTVWPRSP